MRIQSEALVSSFWFLVCAAKAKRAAHIPQEDCGGGGGRGKRRQLDAVAAKLVQVVCPIIAPSAAATASCSRPAPAIGSSNLALAETAKAKAIARKDPLRPNKRKRMKKNI